MSKKTIKKIQTEYSSVESQAHTSLSYTIESSLEDKPRLIRHKNWYIFSSAFLSLAKIGCENILSKTSDEIDRKMVISIVFNLKHAVELFIKTITNSEGCDIEPHHNTGYLIEKLVKSKKVSSPGNKKILEIKEILDKYTKLDFLGPSHTTAFVVCDVQNAIFKYPENKEYVLEIDYNNLISSITQVQVTSILTDVDKLIELLSDLDNIL